MHVYGIDPDYKVPKEINAILIKPTHTRNAGEREQLAKYFREGISVLAEVKVDTGIFAISLSPDGKQVAAAGNDGKVRILAAEGGETVREFVPIEEAAK